MKEQTNPPAVRAMKYLALIPAVLLVSCASRPLPQITVRPLPPQAVEPVEAVRYAEVVRPYHLGRYVDPNQPDTLHEQHPVYRVETPARWNLRPGPVHGTGGSFTHPSRDAAFSPPPTNDVILAELNRQRQVTEIVMWEATRLAESYNELQTVLSGMKAVAQDHVLISERLTATEKRFSGFEEQLRKLVNSPAATTEDQPVSESNPNHPDEEDTLPGQPLEGD